VAFGNHNGFCAGAEASVIGFPLPSAYGYNARKQITHGSEQQSFQVYRSIPRVILKRYFETGRLFQMKSELNIGGMNSDSCAREIKARLENTAGVRDVDVTFKRKTAIVDFDENTVQLNTLLKKIQDLGYQATVEGESQMGVGA
jgi:mercuric ion binding protein